MPPTSQLDWLSSTTAMIVLFWSRATRDLLKSFGWGIAALHRLDAATKLPFPRRPPHSFSRSPVKKNRLVETVFVRPFRHFPFERDRGGVGLRFTESQPRKTNIPPRGNWPAARRGEYGCLPFGSDRPE